MCNKNKRDKDLVPHLIKFFGIFVILTVVGVLLFSTGCSTENNRGIMLLKACDAGDQEACRVVNGG